MSEVDEKNIICICKYKHYFVIVISWVGKNWVIRRDETGGASPCLVAELGPVGEGPV